MSAVRPVPALPERALSTVELYRRGLPLDRSYDLSDPLVRAVFWALQAYVSHEETPGLEAGLRPGDPVYPPWRSPAVFEEDAWTLAAWKGGELLPAPERWHPALGLLRAMFSPAEAGPNDDFTVRPDFFEAGKGYVAPRAPLGPVARERPLEPFWDGLAPLSALLRDALGPLVSQSEAARRLGLTPTAVALRIERKEMRRLRVGRKVLIPAADVGRARSRGRSRGRPRRPPRGGVAGGEAEQPPALPDGLDRLSTAELRALAARAAGELAQREDA